MLGSEIHLDDLEFACTSSRLPSASTLPSCSTVTFFAMLRTKSMSCSTTTTVRSRRERHQQLRRALRLGVRHAGDRLITSKTRGFCAKSMPISSHCF